MNMLKINFEKKKEALKFLIQTMLKSREIIMDYIPRLNPVKSTS